MRECDQTIVRRSELLFRRIKLSQWPDVNGERRIDPSVFFKPGTERPDDECSVYRRQCETADEARKHGPEYMGLGIIEFSASVAMDMPGVTVVPNALDGAPGHALILGLTDLAHCRRLASQSSVLIEPTKPSKNPSRQSSGA